MKKMINEEHIEGYVYQHDLAVKTVQNRDSANFGKNFINGTLDIATDEEGLNIVQIHYTYVTPLTKNGAINKTYETLEKIIESPTWITDGKDAATKVSISTSLGLNEFYAQDGTLVSQKVNEGGFINIVHSISDNKRNNFTVDVLINGINKVEKDETKYIYEDYVSVKGAVFNFRNELLPVDFKVKNEQGMAYFLGLDIEPSAPILTKVWGRIVSETKSVERVEESEWGEACVNTYERKNREWVITGISKNPYEFGDEKIMTAEEVTKCIQDRNVKLADIKQRAEEYRASKENNFDTFTPSNGASGVPNAGVNTGDFKF